MPALLVVGGYGTDRNTRYSTELWGGSHHCKLKNMESKRIGLSLSDTLACGGFWDSASCEVFRGGYWRRLNLSRRHGGHTSWRDPATNKTYLLGGFGSTQGKIVDVVTTSNL